MKRLPVFLTVVAAVALSLSAATASANRSEAVRATAPAAQTAASSGTVGVKFAVQRFIKTRHSLTALGVVTATFTPSDGSAPTTVKQPFRAKVTTAARLFSAQASSRICNVLTLQLDTLSLNLLGLHVDLSKVVLRITANSRGGVLGSLFCSISGRRITLAKAAAKLTKMAHTSGLSTQGVRFAVPASQTHAMAPGPCQVLDLVLGPLHLNLLGLVVDLNQVHLQITAAPNEGVLGNLLCSLTH